MKAKYLVWVLLTVFFSFAAIAIKNVYGTSYCFLFTFLLPSVFYLIKKFTMFKVNERE